jgi:hypothetical protein
MRNVLKTKLLESGQKRRSGRFFANDGAWCRNRGICENVIAKTCLRVLANRFVVSEMINSRFFANDLGKKRIAPHRGEGDGQNCEGRRAVVASAIRTTGRSVERPYIGLASAGRYCVVEINRRRRPGDDYSHNHGRSSP